MKPHELITELRVQAKRYRDLARSWATVSEPLQAEINTRRAERLEMAAAVLSSPAPGPGSVVRYRPEEPRSCNEASAVAASPQSSDAASLSNSKTK